MNVMTCNGVDMRQIYKSDAVKLTGEDNLQGIKLKEDSPAVRYYSTCCGTPLMMDYAMAPFFLVFQHTIDASDGRRFTGRDKDSFILSHLTVHSTLLV